MLCSNKGLSKIFYYMELSGILPCDLYIRLYTGGCEGAQEVRLRVGQAPKVLREGRWAVVADYSVTKECLADIVYNACDKSVYAYAKDISRGFVTTEEGVRIGIAGKGVYGEGEKLTVIKEYTSLVLRFSNSVKGCADKIMPFITNPLVSTLIISPPSAGKTTLLRDIARQLSQNGYDCLVADERGELSNCINEKNVLGGCDVLCANKIEAMTIGTRCLAPQALICDELSAEELELLPFVIYSGVAVFASLHGKDLEEAAKKEARLLSYFQRFAVLSQRLGAGTIEALYDANMKKLCGESV